MAALANTLKLFYSTLVSSPDESPRLRSFRGQFSGLSDLREHGRCPRTPYQDRNQFFTSNRSAADQAPALPVALFARTRHHMVRVGSVLLLNCDVVTV
jgi:hypothetical protein